MDSNRWTKEQLKLAFYLYCQLPFGRLHSKNIEIIKLATFIKRTPSAVAMKLVNFASLDPVIISSGRRGLGNASALDKDVWEEFHSDWEGLATECAQLLQSFELVDSLEATNANSVAEDFTGETRQVSVNQRIKQSFFRRAVLSGYQGRCCMSGLSESSLLIASHIVPWSKDSANRLNPSNGLSLSAIHDKAFDRGLIALSDELEIILSGKMLRSEDDFIKSFFLPLKGKGIELPDRFAPSIVFVTRHRTEVFLGVGS